MGYSSLEAEQQKIRDAEAQKRSVGEIEDLNLPFGGLGDEGNARLAELGQHESTGSSTGGHHYENPGAADYGGHPGGVEQYRDAALWGAKGNDAEQAGNTAALQRSIANMKGAESRGPMAIENQLLAKREQITRGEQLGALGLARDAAMGNAPSEAAYQTRIGQNDALGQHLGALGGARNAASLGGAQTMGTNQVGAASGNVGMAGGLARSKEISDAVGMYGGLAGQVRGQDLTRLGVSNQNSRFNQTLNDEWKIGNANNAIAQGRLGVAQSGLDSGWYDEAMKPAETQFRYDQEMAAEQAGANIDDAANKYEKSKDKRQNTQQVVGGVTSGALTAVGSLGGPAGAAAGGMAGTAINSATSRYY